MKKRWLCLSLAAALTLSAGLLGACAPDEKPDDTDKEPGTQPAESYVMPTWEDVPENWDSEFKASVHDPSVFYDEATEKYYAFGTHYAVASSPDLMAWTQEVGDNEFEKLYAGGAMTYGTASWPAALRETLELVKPGGSSPSTTTWAPDVNFHDGKYYMYYSLTYGFGSRESAIGRVSADSVLGPYSNNEIIIDSMGGSGLDPNCIDPELFTDKEGKLWMVYGSAAGGIYILELENSGERWGLPKEGQGFGTRLWSGTNNQEGPFIFYNEATDYYYLMVSYASLQQNYNMRVARSKNPDGPYVDITGLDVADATGDNGGNKIAGNYEMGDKVNGFAAIGHNSVIEADGKFIVVAHARRQQGSGVDQAHQLYAFQLFFNEEGWPVMSPERYAGEALGPGITADLLEGEYNVVEHSVGSAAEFVKSVAYTFNADGTITDGADAEAGTWTLAEGQYVTITLGGTEYNGVAAPAYESMYVKSEAAMHSAFVFTAVSDAGRSLWAVGTFEAPQPPAQDA